MEIFLVIISGLIEIFIWVFPVFYFLEKRSYNKHHYQVKMLCKTLGLPYKSPPPFSDSRSFFAKDKHIFTEASHNGKDLLLEYSIQREKRFSRPKKTTRFIITSKNPLGISLKLAAKSLKEAQNTPLDMDEIKGSFDLETNNHSIVQRFFNQPNIQELLWSPDLVKLDGVFRLEQNKITYEYRGYIKKNKVRENYERIIELAFELADYLELLDQINAH